MRPRILIVDDDGVIVQALSRALDRAGYEAVTAGCGQEAMEVFAREACQVVLLDVRLPDTDGLSLLARMRELDDDQMFVMMTAYDDAAVAVQAMKAGAYDYIHKPFDLEELRMIVAKALEIRRMRGELAALRQRHGGPVPAHELLGASAEMARIRSLVRRIAQTPRTSVLILGESGTGKERVANAIHFSSERRDFPLMKINCSAIPSQLLESELFGHEKGAFTDAKGTKKGLLEMAHGGTVFLDEVGDLALSLQPKLLRFLESRSLQRVGGLREIQVDARIIAATHRDLEAMVARGTFREDLYYRLKVMVVAIPPLRKRPRDILILAQQFLHEIAGDLGKPVQSLSPEAAGRLVQYPWPGNARELRNVLERAAILSSSPTIRREHLQLDAAWGTPGGEGTGKPEADEGLSLAAAQRQHILRVLHRTGGNRSAAARILGISRSTLQERLKQYGHSSGPRGGQKH
jgi:DNA-binding NtrC family response regulator